MVQPSSQSPADDAADLMLVESSEASVSQVLLLLPPKISSIPDASSSGLEDASRSPESSSAADAVDLVPVAPSAVSVSDPLLPSSVSSSEPDVSPSRLDDVSLPFEPFDATGSMTFLNVFAG